MTVAVPEAGSLAPTSGRRKAAVALVALGPERAAQLLRGLHDDEVAALAREISTLGPVSHDEVRATLEELGETLRSNDMLRAPGKGYAKELLLKALGDERGGAAGAALDAPEPFAWLAEVDPDAAAGVLADEPAGAVALALAHLDPKEAASLLVRLPEQRRGTVAGRLASLGAVHPDTLREVEQGLKARMDDITTTTPITPFAGPSLLAQVLARSGKELTTELLGALSVVSPELADEVRAALFTFDDLCLIEPRQMQLYLREVDMRQLAVAIATSSAAVQGLFTSALSERARETLLEEIDLARSSKAAEVNAARAGLVAVARGLEEAGTLVLRADEEEV